MDRGVIEHIKAKKEVRSHGKQIVVVDGHDEDWKPAWLRLYYTGDFNTA